ncbi:hypothetical protein BN946_scf184831.g6 [Trametes cinnabarina]|uniref:Uncharacterized protein n=1 Tax=Pycnoporus cinnabarinus TaxID=5643 RepID=A0A060SQA9_PYCCI|nr:hypothetical protein BN946_scf184831.g6 [Trametes cinnabarina]
MSTNAPAFRALNDPRADGLLGGLGDGDNGSGLLGNPFSGLPGLSNILPTFTPIGLPPPGGGKSTSADVTSSTISLTSSDTSTSTTSTSTTATSAATSTSATSNTSSLTSGTQSNQSTQQTATDIPTPTPPPPTATPPPGSDSASLPSSSSSSSTSSSASASASAIGANAPKGFLQNKALSVGVITAASLVGLVVIIAIATWAIRKRRNDRLHQDILDFSTANLVSDAEKGSGAGRRDMFTEGGAADNGSSAGHGSGSSSVHGGYSQSSQSQVQPRAMYENQGYAGMPAYASQPAAPRAAYPYAAQPVYADRGYGFPSQEQNNTPKTRMNTAYGGMDDAYGGIAGDAVGVAAGAQNQGPQRRPSAHRKPPPQLYIPPSNPIAQAVPANGASSPISSVSLTQPALQPATGTATAQPPARRTSLLNTPPADSSFKRERRDTLTHVEVLDPSAPKAPVASPPLPDEFGVASPPTSKDSPATEPVRRLVVRNE